MHRIVFSLLLGSIAMSSLPSIVKAADIRQGTIDDVRQGKIVGHGTGVVEQQSFVVRRPDPGLRYEDYHSYGTAYPASSSAYPINRYYSTYRNPDSLYDSYYKTYGYPTSAYPTSGYPTSTYDSYYGAYPYNSPYNDPSYSSYPVYPNPYGYSRYRASYNAGNMYNPNTTFVNPPSSLNDRTRYPAYSETYIRPY